MLLLCFQGYHVRHGFIITQVPLKNTVQDYFGMIMQRSSSVIVYFNDSQVTIVKSLYKEQYPVLLSFMICSTAITYFIVLFIYIIFYIFCVVVILSIFFIMDIVWFGIHFLELKTGYRNLWLTVLQIKVIVRGQYFIVSTYRPVLIIVSSKTPDFICWLF